MARTAYMTPSPKGGLVPLHPADSATVQELKIGKTYKVEITETKGRSIQHHRLLFAILKIIEDNSPVELSKEAIKEALKLKTGHVHLAKLPSGEILMFPASISFEAMPQEEFAPWFEKALVALCRDFVPGLEVETARREIQAIAEGRHAA